MIVLIVIFVGVASFGLGRLSVSSNEDLHSPVVITGSMFASTLQANITTVQGEYVASRNGTKYYPKDCPSAKRILDANKVWFSSTSEAEAAGFSKTATCTY